MLTKEQVINFNALKEMRKAIAKEHEQEAAHAYEYILDEAINVIDQLDVAISDAHSQYKRYEKQIDIMKVDAMKSAQLYVEMEENMRIFRKVTEHFVDNA
jgi:molecular chaperone GrpE (heat shock protein)